MTESKKVIGICNGPTCCKYNKDLKKCAENLKSEDMVFEEAMCLGMCETAPNIRVDENGERIKKAQATPELLEEL